MSSYFVLLIITSYWIDDHL